MKRCTGLLPLLLLGSAAAHHSFAMFDSSRQLSLEGDVREFQFTNPHCFIQLEVKDPSGKTTEWSIEMAAPAHVVAAGWTRATVKPGDHIKLLVHPLRNGQAGASFMAAYGSNGQKL